MSAYEANERAYKSCGEIAKCLKKEHLKDAFPGGGDPSGVGDH